VPTSPGIPSQSLDPKQAVEKFAGLITENTAETDEPIADSTPDPHPAPTPSEASPETSDTEPPASEPDEEDSREVVVDGEPVTIGELKRRGLREADYTRKTMALAEDRKTLRSTVETEVLASVQADRDRYQQGLKQLTDALQSLQGEPDWDQLHKELPAEEFLKRKADWEVSQSHLERLQRHQDQEARTAEDARQQQYQQYIRAEQDKLKAALPEWEDTAKAKAEGERLVAVAKQYGFSEQEVRAIVDHRAILLLRDAMKYRELHRDPNPHAKAKVSQIKTAKPGTPEKPRPNEHTQKLVERAAKTGRGRDAAAAILNMLPDD